jgi:hypothetical protein
MKNRNARTSRFAIVLLLIANALLLSSKANALSGSSDLTYNAQANTLSGYSQTWRDPWDPLQTFECVWYDYYINMWTLEYEYGCVYWIFSEFRVLVQGTLYDQADQYHSSKISAAWFVAVADTSANTPAAGTWKQYGDHYILEDVYVVEWGGWSTYIGSYFYYYGSTLQTAITCPGPEIDNVKTQLLAMPSQEPFERAFAIDCIGQTTMSYVRFTDSFAQIYPPLGTGPTMDPCRTNILVGPSTVGAAHTHPYFTTAAQYLAEGGCHGDTVTPTISELNQLNQANVNFGSGDISGFRNGTIPLYLKTPLGNRVRKLVGTGGGGYTVVEVYP